RGRLRPDSRVGRNHEQGARAHQGGCPDRAGARQAAPPRRRQVMIVMLDNYDSFTYNLVQYLGELGAEVRVVRNDEVTVEDIEKLQPAGIIISPGPCTPNEA